MPASTNYGHDDSNVREQSCGYSITSSARESTIGVISTPIILAVLMLITSSYLVGACTGKSAAFSPLRIHLPSQECPA
jgi:hypothetical protein